MLKDAQAGEEAVRSRMLSQSVGNGIWGQINGLFGTDAATRDAAAVKRNGYGVFGGIDAAIGGHARAGLAGGYTRTSFTIDGRASRGTIRTKQVLGYAGGTLGPVALRASVGYAWSDNSTARRVAFAGYAATHDAKYDGGVLHGTVEAGIKRPLLGGTVEPFAGIETYRVRSDAFAETGTTTALVARAKSETFTLADVGIRADTSIVDGVRARTQLGWRRVIGDVRPNATLAFAGTDAPFTVAGAGLSRDSATMVLDIEWKPVERLSIVAGYSGSIGGNGADDNRLQLTASFGF
jgi:outer membrane autotransporter protein